MDFMDAPIVVGDPEGRAVYVNPPSSAASRSRRSAVATGVPLANLFEGGAREAVLAAVAGVCSGEPHRRDSGCARAGRASIALASPVDVEEGTRRRA